MAISKEDSDDLGSIFAQDTAPEIQSDNVIPDVSVDMASQNDPDAYAESLVLSEELGLPREVVESDMAESRRRKAILDTDMAVIKRDNPKLSAYLENKDNAAVSFDDIGVLKKVEDTGSLYDRSWGEFGADSALDVFSGIVGLGQAAVGITDLLTFNTVGNMLESIGYDVEETNRTLKGHHSLSRKRADKRVADEKGFVDTLGAYLENPSTAFGAVLESAPLMVGISGAVKSVATKMLGRAGIKVGTKEAAVFLARKDVIAKLTLVSAGAEGALTAGQIQEGARSEGRAFLESAPEAVMAGLSTAAISKFSSKFMPDVEVSAAVSAMGKGAKVELLTAGKEIAKGMFKEGVLEEMPQSFQEQIFTNLAMDKPWDEGIGEAAAAGLVTGTGMGGGMTATTQAIGMIGKTEREVATAVSSVAEQDYLDQVIEYAQSTSTGKRAPGHFEEFIESIGPSREVLIPNDIAEQLEGAPEYIVSQLNAVGTSISIPLKKFASEIARNETWMEQLRPHIRLSENTLTQEELQSGESPELAAMLERAQADKETMTESERIYETVKDQIVATGKQSQATARQSSQLYPAAVAVYVEKARKMGKDVTPGEVFEMMGFQVKSEEVEGVADADIDSTTIVDQEAIPDDMEITMESEDIDTGKFEQKTFNAKELTVEIDDKLDSYQKLRDCLA